MATSLVGRQSELATAEQFLDSLAEGPAALLIEGDPGIGKTALLEAVRVLAEGRQAHVLGARPTEPEAGLAMAGLISLLAGVDQELLGRLPEPQRHALDAAQLRAEPDPVEPDPSHLDRAGTDHRALGVAVMTALTTLARDRPVLLVVDDIQWLDPGTASALGFAIRRLRREPVGLIASRRSETVAPFDVASLVSPERLTQIRLEGLSIAGLRAVVASRLGLELDRSSLTKLEQLTRGNPMLALEIVGYLQRRGRAVRVDELSPVPADIRHLVQERVRDLPARSAEALLVVAALGRPDARVLRQALPGSDVEAALAPAIDAGLVHVEQQRVEFDHPLIASAVYSSAAPARRRELHQSLGDRLDDPNEAARHRALATELPDEAVAAELEAAARRVAARGAPDMAVELLDQALRLTPSERVAELGRRSLLLAQHLWDVGDIDRSRRLATEAERLSPPGPQRGLARLLLAAQGLWLDGPASAVEWSLRALEDAADDGALAARAHIRIAYAIEEDTARAMHHVEAALTRLASVGGADRDDLLAAALLLGAYVRSCAGQPVDVASVERARALLPPMPDPSVPAVALNPRGIARERDWLIRERLDDVEGAHEALAAIVAQNRSVGLERSVVIGLADLAELETWLGRAAEAEAHAAEAAAFATRTGETSFALGYTRLAETVVALHRGDTFAAADAIDAGLSRARIADSVDLVIRLTALRGSLALLSGRAADAAKDFDPVVRSLEASGPRHPSMYRFEGDRIESLVLGGNVAAARAAVSELEPAGASLGSSWIDVVAARSCALLAFVEGDLDAALEHIAAAHRSGSTLHFPLEIGRIDLLEGQILRRRRQKRLADEALRRALARFEGAGANGWAARARTELGRIGLRPRAPGALSETEHEVARLAATGLTNRQVAEALVLSPKTIDGVLIRVYRKLGIRSRAELGAVMAGERGAGAEIEPH